VPHGSGKCRRKKPPLSKHLAPTEAAAQRVSRKPATIKLEMSSIRKGSVGEGSRSGRDRWHAEKQDQEVH